jgi:glycerol-3-phosphate dehydrogenase (NAD(P)+)
MSNITVAVVGAGSWGTTVAHLAAHNVPTVLWARDAVVADEVNTTHRNSRYLPDYELHPGLRATADLAEAVSAADVVVMGVPSSAFRHTLTLVAPHIRAWVPVVSLTKGLEQDSGARMSELIDAGLPGHPAGALSGPNLAKEIMAGGAAATVLAMSDDNVATALQQVFSTPTFRVYTNPDIVGCELGGALKNVMAIASGMADGLGAGDNTRSAIITRGLAELTRLGVAMGGQPLTFAGLAGMGDLIATCVSPQSRNRHVGEQLGRGLTLAEVAASMDQVAEGVKTTPVVLELARRHGVEMPIAQQVHAVCFEGASATDAYRNLLGRPNRREMEGFER